MVPPFLCMGADKRAHVPFAFNNVVAAVPHVQSGRLRPMAVATAQRVPNVDVDLQGFGALQPAAAVERALAAKK